MRGAYPRKRDDNEAVIIIALRDAGATVTQLDDTGVPDLLVGWHGRTFLMEVKVPERKDGKAHTRKAMGGAGELTEAQVKWWSEWRGERAAIVHSADEALAVLAGGPLGSGDGCLAPTDRAAYPTFNHTRGDSPLTPCPKCRGHQP